MAADKGKEEMHKSAVKTAAKHAKDLFNQNYGAEFRKVAETVPKFAAELSVQILDNSQNAGFSLYQCSNSKCNKTVMIETLSSTSRYVTHRWCNYCGSRHEETEWMRKVITSD